MKIYLTWSIGVIIWNFGSPYSSPIQNVIVAIILSFFSTDLKKAIK